MRVGIAHLSIFEGDAIGNDVRGMAHALRQRGHQVELFADRSNVPDAVRPMAELGGLDTFIYHHSIYNAPGVHYLLHGPGRKIVKYHNITPPHFFEPGSEVRRMCEAGLAQLADILAGPCEVWADSTYNGEQLTAVRPVRYTVVPPFHQVDALCAAQAADRAVQPLKDGSTNLLVVGRVAPNKDVLAAVDAFVAYRRSNPASRLLIVGELCGSYAEKVAARIRDLGLTGRAILTGTVSRGMLKALYQVADALLVTSRHEGFCVPVVEAMAFGVPVVSRSDAALSETGASVARFCDGDPEDWALAIGTTLANRDEHVRAGRDTYERRFRTSQIAAVFNAAFG
jgi:glycosyltransferase involved in cell wall biosynthesis